MGYATRDQQGCAVKSTYVEVEEENVYSDSDGRPTVVRELVGREIFKDPITDDGLKKSAKGLLKVLKGTRDIPNTNIKQNKFYLVEQCSWEGESTGELKEVFLDGKLTNPVTMSEIRERLNSQR